MSPKGRLLIIGGKEDKGGQDDKESTSNKSRNRNFKHYEILKELLPKKKGLKYTIEIITTASEIPSEIDSDYRKAFKRLGFDNVNHLNIKTRQEANDQKMIRRVQRAHAILFTGNWISFSTKKRPGYYTMDLV